MKNYAEKLTDTKDVNDFFSKMIDHHLHWMNSIPNPNPLWLILLKNGKIDILNIINAIKQSPMEAVGEIIKQKKPDAYIFFAEGWSKKMTSEQMKKVKWGDVSKSKDKKECLTVFGRSIDGLHEVKKIFWIKRVKNQMYFTEDTKFQEMKPRCLP